MDNIKGTALITGAGRGIGLELCKWFGEQGIHTIGISRNVSALKNLINVEAIEATGYAPVWGNSMNAARESYRVAELEAKKSLNDFINKETITSTTSVRMISKNLEQAEVCQKLKLCNYIGQNHR